MEAGINYSDGVAVSPVIGRLPGLQPFMRANVPWQHNVNIPF